MELDTTQDDAMLRPQANVVPPVFSTDVVPTVTASAPSRRDGEGQNVRVMLENADTNPTESLSSVMNSTHFQEVTDARPSPRPMDSVLAQGITNSRLPPPPIVINTRGITR